MAGVLVVLLEQVAQEQGRAAVGAAELEALQDAALALALEAAQQGDERQDEKSGGGEAGGGHRGQQAERCEQDVDALSVPELGQERPHGRAVAPEARADAEHTGVGDELRGERGDIGRPVGQVRLLGAERDEDERPGRARTRRRRR